MVTGFRVLFIFILSCAAFFSMLFLWNDFSLKKSLTAEHEAPEADIRGPLIATSSFLVVASTSGNTVVGDKQSIPLPIVQPPLVDIPVVVVPQVKLTCEEIKKTSKFFVDPDSQVARQEKRLKEEERWADAQLLNEVSCFPQGIWIVSDDLAYIRNRVKKVVAQAVIEKKIPIFVLYNIPDHTTLNLWSGVQSGASYIAWAEAVAEEIGSTEAWVIYEPDMLGLLPNLKSEDRKIRIQDMQKGLSILQAKNPNARIYIDAGHADWRKPNIIADILNEIGIGYFDGLSLNVANFQSIEESTGYSRQIEKLTNIKNFVIDTSRNGLQLTNVTEWCNTPGTALGRKPTRDTEYENIDAYLWVKPPGESDGTCNGGPPAGKFWFDQVKGMIEKSPYRAFK